MRRALPLALLLVAVPAFASPGVNLRWSQCFGDGGTINRSFACDTNSGVDELLGSFVLYQDFPQAAELQAVVDIAVAGSTLPAWWQFRNPGTCRQSSLVLTLAAPPTAVACQDWSNGGALGAFTYTTPNPFPNTARIRIDLVSNFLGSLSAGAEYFAFGLRIDHAKTIGTGACAGCSSAACLVLRQIEILGPPAPVQATAFISGATTAAYDSFFALWQGGAVSTPFGFGCPNSVPVRRETWSRVKSLYR